MDINHNTNIKDLVHRLGLDPDANYCCEIIDSRGRSITSVGRVTQALQPPFIAETFTIRIGDPCSWPYKLVEAKTMEVFNITDWTAEDAEFMNDYWSFISPMTTAYAVD